MIRIENIHKSFGEQRVLRGINLHIAQGETIGIVGPSGTGKSVLLKIVTGLLPADRGRVQIGDVAISADSSFAVRAKVMERIGILFQGAALLDSMTLLENLAFPLIWRNANSKKEIERKCLQRLEEVGMRGYEHQYPQEVSIGMRKRIGIARALITNPQIILFDEPNTGLDPESGQEIYDLINHIRQAEDITGIVISHEIPEVYQICDSVAMLYKGHVQEYGPVAEFIASKDAIVHQFVHGHTEGPMETS